MSISTTQVLTSLQTMFTIYWFFTLPTVIIASIIGLGVRSPLVLGWLTILLWIACIAGMALSDASRNTDLAQWFMFPLAAGVFVFVGLAVGWILHLFLPPGRR